MSKEKNACIIGCGISGLSVAHLLQENNWTVTIISEADPRVTNSDPTFSSLFPAASIIPHNVASEEIHTLFKESLSYYDFLYENQFPGLKVHEHFELFATDQSFPDYAELLNAFTPFQDFRNSFHPRHPEIDIRSGWRFNCYFADWSLYFPALLNKVLENGALLQIKSLQNEDLGDLPFDVIINCSGLGSIQLFNDPHDLIYRGHLLQILDAPILKNPDEEIVSYNFSPGVHIYQSENGSAQDVYCYPRSDGWIFGGSRQKGRIDKNGNWIGEKCIPPTKKIDGITVPEQLYKLHQEIIKNTFGIQADRFNSRKAKLGYRFVRKREDGLRLEAEERSDRLFIHNYGHGGAGVTLSWGCANRVLNLLNKKLN